MANNDFRHYTSSNYSNQYSTLQQHHLEQLREEILGNKEDSSIKNRKLSAETNKRRRDLINRKKARESEEEKRRNEILAERKARIQDVTHRYQRGSAPKANVVHSHHHRTKSPRNKRAYSAPVSRNNQINLEDALRTIRGNTQLQYNVGDSGTVFLQKYGAHLHQGNIQSNQGESYANTDATSMHRPSVRQHPNNSSSMFENQLAQHQVMTNRHYVYTTPMSYDDSTGYATLNKAKADVVQVYNERLVQDMKLDGGSVGPPDTDDHADNESIASTDSLDSEQPSYRSHVINSGAGRNSTTSNNKLTPEQSSGSDTYRQESPTVVLDDNQRPKAPIASQSRAQSAPVYRQVNSTTATPTTDPHSFLGFQVVNTTDYKHTPSHLSDSLSTTNVHTTPTSFTNSPQTTTLGNQSTRANEFTSNSSRVNNSDVRSQYSTPSAGDSESISFYLKSRTESQSLVNDFPTHAWGVEDTPLPANEVNTEPQAMPSQAFVDKSNPPLNDRFSPAVDTFSDTASDCGAPRSILKKRDSRSATLPRSQSSPSIRDSVELTKQHLQSTGYRGDTPKSAKKSVRFSEKNSEPVFFQKGSSPSSIPRPVNAKSKVKNNVPHISGAITPNVSDKSLATKQQSTTPHKGPVVARHHIQANQTAAAGKPAAVTADNKPAVNETQAKSKPSLSDIRLDRTPTDDEIDLLWDKVRDCLQESPMNSVRSAPPDLQQNNEQRTATNFSQNSSLPPKPPIKKITASNINLIGRAQSAAAVRRQTSLDGPQSPLQRPKQDQTSFLQPDTAHNHLSRHTNQHSAHAVPNGHMAPSRIGPNSSQYHHNGPIHSVTEPNHSAVSNQHNVSESMMSYLAAEQLATHDSMSDNDIIKALGEPEYREKLGVGSRQPPPMSALSLEEQRIMKSLDRLNNKLKVVEEGSLSNRSQADHQQSMMAAQMHNGVNHTDFNNILSHHKAILKPHPPYTGSASARSFSATARGFRGHKPIQPRQRTASADTVRQNGMNTAAVSGTNRQFRLY